jgi:hypothetical protein
MPGEVSGLPPPAPVLSGGSRIADHSSPGHAHGNTPRIPRHHPCAYIMKRGTYPRASNLWFAIPSPRSYGERVMVVEPCFRHAVRGGYTRHPRGEPVEPRLVLRVEPQLGVLCASFDELRTRSHAQTDTPSSSRRFSHARVREGTGRDPGHLNARVHSPIACHRSRSAVARMGLAASANGSGAGPHINRPR